MLETKFDGAAFAAISRLNGNELVGTAEFGLRKAQASLRMSFFSSLDRAFASA